MLNRYITLFTRNVLLGLSECRESKGWTTKDDYMRRDSCLLSRRERGRETISPRHGEDPLALQIQREVQRARSSFWLCCQQSLARLRAGFHSLKKKKLIRCSREREKKEGFVEEISPVTIVRIVGSQLGSRAFCSAFNNTTTTGLSDDDWCCCCCYCQILDGIYSTSVVRRWNEGKR